MSTGKAIFLIVVLLVGSFIFLGYLINQSIDQVKEIQALRSQNADLQAALDEATKAHSEDHNRVQELDARVKTLQEEVAWTKMAATQTIETCGNTAFTQPPDGEPGQPVSGGILLASSLAGLITGGSIHHIRNHRNRGIK